MSDDVKVGVIVGLVIVLTAAIIGTATTLSTIRGNELRTHRYELCIAENSALECAAVIDTGVQGRR